MQTGKTCTVKVTYDGKEISNTTYNTEDIGFDEYYREDEIYSSAKENVSARNSFNKRFIWVYHGNASNIEGEITPLQYRYIYENNEYKSILEGSVDGQNPASTDKDFRMSAITERAYTESTKGVSFGLVKKNFDLAVSNSVKKVTYKINGQEFIDDNYNEEDTTYDATYRESDYNYRFGDYNGDEVGFANDSGTDRSGLVGQDSELQVEVTHNFRVINSTPSVEVGLVRVEYRYNPDQYTLKSINKKDEETTYYELEKGKITFTVKGKDLVSEEGIELVFTVNKDSNRNLVTGEIKTEAEIMVYETKEGGYIDIDSAPGNGKEEDDMAICNINFTVANDDREISGRVAEADKEGVLDYNKPVDDVIVQLIEIVHEDRDYEYIWQETRSGSNKVKARTRHQGTGNDVYTYYTDVQEGTGEYKFIGSVTTVEEDALGTQVQTMYKSELIPGDYIIRFIYGDGRTYDVTPNVQKYNGQDYKSATDKGYQALNYPYSGVQDNYYDYSEGGTKDASKMSKARDNEARRLKVMAYSVGMDKTMWERLENKEEEMLENTWMCAETSLINVKLNSTTPVKETAVNFGLELRPKTKIMLEKHITGLKITPEGNGAEPVVEARIKSILDMLNSDSGNTIETTGINNHLKAIKDAIWEVTADIEEVIRGATLEVEYTYVIKNESDLDYITAALASEYEARTSSDPSGESYKTYLLEKANEYDTRGKTSNYGRFLGAYYYNNKDKAGLVPVKVRVAEINDYINNSLEYTESSNNAFTKITGKTLGYIDTNGDFQQNASVKVALKNNSTFKALEGKDGQYTENNTDFTKSIRLKATLDATKEGISIPMYMAEIVSYSTATGTRDKEACPGNLEFAYSEDKRIGKETYLYETDEVDEEGNKLWEFGTSLTEARKIGALKVWDYSKLSEISTTIKELKVIENDEFGTSGGTEAGETIIVRGPDGANKEQEIPIALIAISSVAAIGLGIFLIKKYVLAK